MDKLLETMLQTNTPSGYEQSLQKVIQNYTKKFSKTKIDQKHNLYSIINEDKNFKILMCAHADEIGLIITSVKGNGTCTVRNVGGINASLYPGCRVNILHGNDVVKGIVGVKSGITKVDELFIDLGTNTKEETLKLISVGDELVLEQQPLLLNKNRLTSKALDDKIGCYVITKVLEKLSERKINNQVCSCTTTAEETGATGAYFASSNFKPNIALIVDVTYETSVVGNPSDYGDIKLGDGPAICHSTVVHKKLNNFMTKIAEKNKIKLQCDVMARATSTDGDKVHLSNDGVSICLLSIPLRYMHSNVELVDLNDVENAIKLLVEFITEINEEVNLSDLSL